MKIPFTASARTAMLIGSENFSNPEGAIIELVKNTYDADSPCCYILFDGVDNQYSDIYIIDYGCGMDIDTIIDCWMQIGTDDKQNHIETATGRIKSGAKGIGRFALNRLGEQAVMYTCKDGGNAYAWKVDWEDFNDFNSYNLSFFGLTTMAEDFLKTVEKAGYKGMIYGSKNYLEKIWLPTKYDIWLAHYTEKTNYNGNYKFWQMCDDGKVSGISTPVDIDIMYKK